MPGPTKSREELIASFSNTLFSAMLDDIIMNVVLQSHKDAVYAKSLCKVCGTCCGSVHSRQAQVNGAGPSKGASSSTLPHPPSSPPLLGIAAAGKSTPTPKEKNDGNTYFECTNCQKKIASNRYAPHLSGCLGLGPGSRRGAARNASAKNKLGSETDRGGSPFVGTDHGSPSHEPLNGVKGKGKGSNRGNGKLVDADLNENRKRLYTPDGTPVKKNKKQKNATAGADNAMLHDETFAKPHVPSPNRIPVKPEAASASPHAPASPSAASGSQYSGRDSPPVSQSASSLANSPSNTSNPPKNTYKLSSSTLKKRAVPPGSVKNHTGASVGPVAAKSMPEEVELDPDFIDVDGEEEEEEDSSSDSSNS